MATPEVENACPNCGEARRGRFCWRCGQNDRNYSRSLWRVVADVLKEAFEVDGRIVRTLRSLFLRPGELAAEFSVNRRASYVSPIRTYLFASIVFFLVLAVRTDLGERPAKVKAHEQDVPTELADERAERREACAEHAERFKLALPAHQRRKVDEIVSRGPDTSIPKTFLCDSMEPLLIEMKRTQADGGGPIRMAVATSLAGGMVEVLHDPRNAFNQLMDNLPLAMFVTLPGFALLLKFFFWGSRRFYAEHLVFSVYLHAFAYLAYTVVFLLPESSPNATGMAKVVVEVTDWIGLGIIFWNVGYSYFALRRYYRNGRFKTFCKWLALGFCYGLLLVPGLMLSVGFTLYQL